MQIWDRAEDETPARRRSALLDETERTDLYSRRTGRYFRPGFTSKIEIASLSRQRSYTLRHPFYADLILAPLQPRV